MRRAGARGPESVEKTGAKYFYFSVNDKRRRYASPQEGMKTGANRAILVGTHKFRSFLTILGVLIGTTTVIAVTSIIAGLDKQLVDVAEQFGTRTLWVYKLQLGAPHVMTREERLRKPLSYEDAMAIKEQSASTTTVSVELFREIGDFG